MNKQVWCLAGLMAVCGQAFAATVNVNQADAQSLSRELRGVGAVIANHMVDERAKGHFRDLEDLKLRVIGIGDKRVEQNRERIRFKD